MNIYIDAGFYQGVALKQYIEAGIVDNTWKIYVFEPSPQIDLDKQLERFDLKVISSRKACWTHDGTVNFWLSGHDNASHIEGTSGHAETDMITVPCIDFSDFVASLPEAYIICNMDIEGAEFDVLEKMLQNHTAECISILDVEFHHRMMGERTAVDAEKIIAELEERGVEVKNKIDLR